MPLDRIIDDQSDPGAYADKFKDAQEWIDPFIRVYREHGTARGLVAKAAADPECAAMAKAAVSPSARCYRDRKAHDKLIATTNEIRAKHGMEPLS